MNFYTTTKGKTLPLTPKLWAGIERKARQRFDGSRDLFDECWKEYLGFVAGGTDDPENIDDVMGWLDSIASEKVNDSESDFYIYG